MIGGMIRRTFLVALLPILLAACANRSGTAYLEIVNEQNSGGKAEPVMVDPRVEVLQNEYRRSYINEGSNIKQRIILRGPIMIVPAPATQPAQR